VPHVGHSSPASCAGTDGGEGEAGGVETGDAEEDDAADTGRGPWAAGGAATRTPQTSHQSAVLV
jgi:hypothetical protein